MSPFTSSFQSKFYRGKDRLFQSDVKSGLGYACSVIYGWSYKPAKNIKLYEKSVAVGSTKPPGVRSSRDWTRDMIPDNGKGVGLYVWRTTLSPAQQQYCYNDSVCPLAILSFVMLNVGPSLNFDPNGDFVTNLRRFRKSLEPWALEQTPSSAVTTTASNRHSVSAAHAFAAPDSSSEDEYEPTRRAYTAPVCVSTPQRVFSAESSALMDEIIAAPESSDGDDVCVIIEETSADSAPPLEGHLHLELPRPVQANSLGDEDCLILEEAVDFSEVEEPMELPRPVQAASSDLVRPKKSAKRRARKRLAAPAAVDQPPAKALKTGGHHVSRRRQYKEIDYFAGKRSTPPTFRDGCAFCGLRHPKWSADSTVNCPEKLNGARCVYPPCNTKDAHVIGCCAILHSYCVLCQRRGHYDGRCGAATTEEFARFYAEFARLGDYTSLVSKDERFAFDHYVTVDNIIDDLLEEIIFGIIG